MINSEKEQLFIEYWEANREREGKLSTQLLVGIPVGILFSFPVLVILITAKLWYKRADMAANAMMSPAVLVIAVLIISGFVAVIYKRHQWDMKEQQYLEFKARRDQRGSAEPENVRQAGINQAEIDQTENNNQVNNNQVNNNPTEINK
jgi:hypothetical protein